MVEGGGSSGARRGSGGGGGAGSIMREGGGVHAGVEIETEEMWVGIGTMMAPFFLSICIGLDAQDVQDMLPGGHKNKSVM